MKTKAFISLILAVLVLVLPGCGDRAQYTDKTIFGMDTYITMRLANDGADEETMNKAAEECAYIIAKNEKLMSSHNEDSHVYALNNNVDMILDPADELREVLNEALVIARLTDGAYNPALGALTELWNVTGGGPVPSEEAVEDALEHTDYTTVNPTVRKITKGEGVKLDLGGIGKGYTVQELVTHLTSTGISYGVVSMGGNIGVFGEKKGGDPFKVGICDPDNTENVVGYVYINSGFIAVSGDYERFFEADGEVYHHILDPDTGYPADSGLRSVTVWAHNGAVADALSTALFVMGEEGAMELYRSGELSFEAIMITDDHEIIITDGLANSRFELSLDSYSVRGAEGVDITLIETDN